ncbi:M23 family metallopeptidase [Patescibacteria group bacterium]
MKQNFVSLVLMSFSLLRALLKLLISGILYGFWSVILGLLMLPYQIFKVFMPVPGQSSKVSGWFRTAFESKKTKRFVGIGLMMIILFAGLMGNILAANEIQTDSMIITSPDAEIVTENTLEKPFDGVVAQGFHGFHRAIDLLSPVGTEMRPIARGTVIEASMGRIGWGNTVVIQHDYGLVSRYAHLKDIRVVEGEKIEKNIVLGTVGMTGWTTGPHLHLEIYQNGRAINPLEILPSFNGNLLARAK